MVARVVKARGPDYIRVKYVPGHATACDIAAGRITMEENDMNKEADSLAVKGAALHAVPGPLKAQLRRQQLITSRWQKALIAIHAD